MAYGHLITIHTRGIGFARGVRRTISNNLVAEEIEIHPVRVGAAFGATQQAAIEGPRFVEIVNGEGEVKGRQAHDCVVKCIFR